MAAQFDGTNYLSVALASTETVPITILCWQYSNDDQGQATIVSVAPATSNNYFSVRHVDAGTDIYSLEASVRAGGSGTLRTASVSSLAIQNWRSVVARFISSSDLKIHVDDGTPAENLDTQTAPTTPNVLYIGTRQGVEVLPNLDRVARVVLVNRDVTTEEITAFDAGDWPPDLFGGDLLRFYDFPEGEGFLLDYQSSNALTETGAGAITHVADPPGLSYGATGTNISADTDALLVTENAATVTSGNAFTGVLAELTLTPFAAAVPTQLNPSVVTLGVTANQAGIGAGSDLLADTVNISMFPRDATRVGISTTILADSVALSVTENNHDLAYNLIGEVDSFSVTPNSATVRASNLITAGFLGFSIETGTASLNQGTSIAGVVDEFTITANGATVVADYSLDANLATLTLTEPVQQIIYDGNELSLRLGAIVGGGSSSIWHSIRR